MAVTEIIIEDKQNSVEASSLVKNAQTNLTDVVIMRSIKGLEDGVSGPESDYVLYTVPANRLLYITRVQGYAEWDSKHKFGFLEDGDGAKICPLLLPNPLHHNYVYNESYAMGLIGVKGDIVFPHELFVEDGTPAASPRVIIIYGVLV